MRFSPRYFAQSSEPVDIKRVDLKNPDQSKDMLTTVGSIRAMVRFDNNPTFTSDAGLDSQSFRFKVYIPKGELAGNVKNKDVISRANGTQLHVGYCEDMKVADYVVAYCSDVRDPTAQRRN